MHRPAVRAAEQQLRDELRRALLADGVDAWTAQRFVPCSAVDLPAADGRPVPHLLVLGLYVYGARANGFLVRASAESQVVNASRGGGASWLVLLSERIGAGTAGAGLLLTGYTVGATASFLLSLTLPAGRHAGPLATGCMTAYSVALVGLGHTGSLAGPMVLYGALGAASAHASVVLVSIVQRRMPPHAGARVMSILSLVIVGALPLGNLTIGALTQSRGIPTAMAAHGALAFAGVVAFAADRGPRPAHRPPDVTRDHPVLPVILPP